VGPVPEELTQRTRARERKKLARDEERCGLAGGPARDRPLFSENTDRDESVERRERRLARDSKFFGQYPRREDEMAREEIEGSVHCSVASGLAPGGRELIAPQLLDIHDVRHEGPLGSAAARHRVGEPRDPPSVVVQPEERQSRGVARDVASDRHADGRRYQERESSNQQP
jgi:hypothetical protein